MEFRHPSYYKKLRANRQQATGRERTSYKLPGSRPISEGNKGLIHRRQATGPGRVGPKDSSGQASSGSRINKR